MNRVWAPILELEPSSSSSLHKILWVKLEFFKAHWAWLGSVHYTPIYPLLRESEEFKLQQVCEFCIAYGDELKNMVRQTMAFLPLFLASKTEKQRVDRRIIK